MMLATALYGPVSEGAELAGRSGLNVLESSLLGAITVLSLLVAIFAVWKLNRVQNDRVEDQKQMSERMEKLGTQLASTFSETKNTLNNLTEAEKEGQELLQQLKSSIDNVIMAAVRRPSSSPPR